MKKAKKSRLTWILVLAGVAGISVWAARHGHSAGAEGQPGKARWEYARVYISAGKVTLHEAGKESTIQPPQNRLSGNIVRGDVSGERYTATSKVVRDLEAGALNLIGSQGWEAVAVTPRDKGFMILMKRPY